MMSGQSHRLRVLIVELKSDWVLAIDIYGVANGIKNADGILLGGFDMVNVQKNLSPDPMG